LVTDEEARSAAVEILAANDFARWHEDYESWLALLERIVALTPDWLLALLTWVEQTVGTIFGWIGELLGLFGVFGEVSAGAGWVAVCIMVAALVVLGWRWRTRRAERRTSDPVERSPGRIHAKAIRDASTMARTGQYLEAAHRVQLATLALLIEFDWFELARSDPNRTLRERVRASALPERERHRLIDLVNRLEALWFDEPHEDRVLFEDWISLDERIASIAVAGRV
jgi:hypothetical protein